MLRLSEPSLPPSPSHDDDDDDGGGVGITGASASTATANSVLADVACRAASINSINRKANRDSPWPRQPSPKRLSSSLSPSLSPSASPFLNAGKAPSTLHPPVAFSSISSPLLPLPSLPSPPPSAPSAPSAASVAGTTKDREVERLAGDLSRHHLTRLPEHGFSPVLEPLADCGLHPDDDGVYSSSPDPLAALSFPFSFQIPPLVSPMPPMPSMPSIGASGPPLEVDPDPNPLATLPAALENSGFLASYYAVAARRAARAAVSSAQDQASARKYRSSKASATPAATAAVNAANSAASAAAAALLSPSLPLCSESLAMPHLAPAHADVPSSGYDVRRWLDTSSTLEVTAPERTVSPVTPNDLAPIEPDSIEPDPNVPEPTASSHDDTFNPDYLPPPLPPMLSLSTSPRFPWDQDNLVSTAAAVASSPVHVSGNALSPPSLSPPPPPPPPLPTPSFYASFTTLALPAPPVAELEVDMDCGGADNAAGVAATLTSGAATSPSFSYTAAPACVAEAPAISPLAFTASAPRSILSAHMAHFTSDDPSVAARSRSRSRGRHSSHRSGHHSGHWPNGFGNGGPVTAVPADYLQAMAVRRLQLDLRIQQGIVNAVNPGRMDVTGHHTDSIDSAEAPMPPSGSVTGSSLAPDASYDISSSFRRAAQPEGIRKQPSQQSLHSLHSLQSLSSLQSLPMRYQLSAEVALRCPNLVHSRPRMRRRKPKERSERGGNAASTASGDGISSAGGNGVGLGESADRKRHKGKHGVQLAAYSVASSATATVAMTETTTVDHAMINADVTDNTNSLGYMDHHAVEVMHLDTS